MKLLKTIEEKMLERAKKEAEKNTKIIEEIQQKATERQGQLDSMKRDFENRTRDYQYRCNAFFVNQPASLRFALFCGWYCSQVNKTPVADLLETARKMNVLDILQNLDKIGQPGEIAPVEPDYNVIEE